MKFTEHDTIFMKAALRLAARARGQTTPNPAVGAVIVLDDKIVARGYHRRAGEDHAEVAAIKNADVPLAGATMYVTLEPCSHHGRTPPCVDAVREAGIARVVAAVGDPHRRVNGRGFKNLREAGIEVDVGLLRDEAIRLNEAFVHFHLTGKPLMICKWALTLDGQAAAASGDSKWITNERSRRYVHRLRAQSDAILAGIGTVLIDNPSLNVRLPNYRGRQPIRIVADAGLRTPLEANCIRAQPGGQTWFLVTEAARKARVKEFEKLGCRVLKVKGRHPIVDFRSVIALLAREGVQSLFVEGGPTIHAALLRDGLCDKIVAFIAPKTVGVRPRYRRNAVYGWGKELMSQALALHEVRIRRFGDDVCVQGDCRPWAERFERL